MIATTIRNDSYLYGGIYSSFTCEYDVTQILSTLKVDNFLIFSQDQAHTTQYRCFQILIQLPFFRASIHASLVGLPEILNNFLPVPYSKLPCSSTRLQILYRPCLHRGFPHRLRIHCVVLSVELLRAEDRRSSPPTYRRPCSSTEEYMCCVART